MALLTSRQSELRHRLNAGRFGRLYLLERVCNLAQCVPIDDFPRFHMQRHPNAVCAQVSLIGCLADRWSTNVAKQEAFQGQPVQCLTQVSHPKAWLS